MFTVKVVKNDQELEQAYKIRKEVFVVEQNVPIEEEIDHLEETATHFLLLKDGVPIGASRTRDYKGIAKIERVCIVKSERKDGAGSFIMNFMHSYCKNNGFTTALLNAQTHAENFYKKLGYETESDIFLDAGIPHVTMRKSL